MKKTDHFQHPCTPLGYGDKLCMVCSLTVALFINGSYYIFNQERSGYVHDGCVPHMNLDV